MTYKYFIITSGLRGCYMPDSNTCLSFETRRELKSYLQGEADAREGVVGLSKENIAWGANHAWKGQDTIIPFALSRGSSPAYCIELTPTTRKDYLQRQKDDAE